MELGAFFFLVLVVGLGLQLRDLLDARHRPGELGSTLAWLLASGGAALVALLGGPLGGSLAVGLLVTGALVGWRLRWTAWGERRELVLPDPDAHPARAEEVIRARLDEIEPLYDSEAVGAAAGVGLVGGLTLLFALGYMAPVLLLVGGATLTYPVQRLMRHLTDRLEGKALRERMAVLTFTEVSERDPREEDPALPDRALRLGDPGEVSAIPAPRPEPAGIVGSSVTGPSVPRPAAGETELLWRRTAPFARRSELLLGERVVGELGPAARSGYDAWGECFGEEWDLRMERPMFGISVQADLTSGGRVGARYRGISVGRGRIEMDGAAPLRWGRRLLRMGWQEIRGPGGVLVSFRPTRVSLGDSRTRVELGPRMREAAELPRLLLLGWFLRLHRTGFGGRVFRRMR